MTSQNKIYLSFVFSAFLFAACPYFALASDASVSAIVPNYTVNPPILLSPAHQASLNTTKPAFSWSRPNPLPLNPLHHYHFYLDSSLFAANLSDSLTSLVFSTYYASASGGIFYLTPRLDLDQGYHTWSVTAYTEASLSASSAVRSFYLDSLPPFISLTDVDRTSLVWTTSDLTSIPELQNRYLTVTTASPILKGGVEASANFQIILICPTNRPGCVNQTYTSNIPTGLWQHQFTDLLAGYTYTVKISATDAGGNSTLFPDFFITYGTELAATPSATPLPGAITPPAGLLAIVTPTPAVYKPPVAPTPPPSKVIRAPLNWTDLLYRFLLVLLVIGLPLHLLMSAISTQTPLKAIPQFLFILAFPFFRSKKYRTTPFTFIDLFIADKLDHPWQTAVTDIQGYFNLKESLPEQLLVTLSAFGRTWRDTLFKGTTIPLICFYPLPVRQLDRRQRLLKLLYDTRVIPLAIACLTSLTVLIIKPSSFVGIYFYFSLQYLFSEYFYPRLSQP